MRLWRMGYEPLRAARVFARQGHAHGRAVVRNFVNLAANLITRPAVGIATRITRLNHKVRYHARNRLAVKEPFARQLNEVVNRQRRILRWKLDRERSFAGYDRR